MMKKHILLILVVVLTACSAQKKSPYKYKHFKDKRDGHVYKTVKIGDQIWMAENLDYDFKPGPKNSRAAFYGNDPGNEAKFGRLYNFDAVLQNIAPKGWHVPSDAEWRQMELACPDPATTLHVLYGGYGNSHEFMNMNEEALFYTATQSGYPIIVRRISKADGKVKPSVLGIGHVLSIRCVKDAPVAE